MDDWTATPGIDRLTAFLETKTVWHPIGADPADDSAGPARAAGRPVGLRQEHRLAEESGVPLLDLDDFYKDGDDPTVPRHPTLGIVDWDDPRSWDAEGALAALEAICRDGAADVPVYDIFRDGRVGTRRFEDRDHRAFVGTGIFAAELVGPARERGLLADAVVVRRSRFRTSCAGWPATCASTASPR